MRTPAWLFAGSLAWGVGVGLAGTAGVVGCSGDSDMGSGGAATGGQSGPGGAGPTGGGPSGGSGGGGGTPAEILEPTLPDLEGKTEVSCSVDVTSADLSDAIGTVGIVEFETDLTQPSAAAIEFGLTTDYGLVAPVVLSGTNRTLLLGMTTDSEYHYRALVVSDDEYCYGPDETISTGPLPAGGPSHLTPEVGGSSVPKTPGFFVTTQFNGEWIYIFDQDGRIVWYFRLPFVQTSRALQSWDGRRMYAKHLNVGRNELGQFFEVMMDGSSPRELSLPTAHHDFTATPEGVVYIRKTPESACDSLYLHRTGAADASQDERIFDVDVAFPSGGGEPILGEQSCHTNSVHYDVRDGGFTASDLSYNAYFKVSAAGELEWVLGSDDSTLTLDGPLWDKQHGHHLLPGDVLVFFNNASANGSVVREVGLDLAASTASFRPFVYDSGQVSGTMGDVQRLPNGNTVVFYSNQGVVHEVDPDGELVQAFMLSTGSGYGTHRPSLYGIPPE